MIYIYIFDIYIYIYIILVLEHRQTAHSYNSTAASAWKSMFMKINVLCNACFRYSHLFSLTDQLCYSRRRLTNPYFPRQVKICSWCRCEWCGCGCLGVGDGVGTGGWLGGWVCGWVWELWRDFCMCPAWFGHNHGMIPARFNFNLSKPLAWVGHGFASGYCMILASLRLDFAMIVSCIDQ